MAFRYCISQLMHDEHMMASAMLAEMESLLAGAGPNPPDVTIAQIEATLMRAAEALEGEVSDHFDFEEKALFPLLAENGEAEIGVHLSDDHRLIEPLAEQVIMESRAALSGGFSDTTWNAFRLAAGELVERLSAHIDKEEKALLPLLEDALDPETDLAFCERHGNRS